MKIAKRIASVLGAGALSLGLVVGLSGFSGVAQAATAKITKTGPDSFNKVKTKTIKKAKVTNNNHLGVANSNAQSASTGDAKVKHNTTGGDAKTGAAANNNTTKVTGTVSNTGAATAAAAALSGGGGSSNSTIDTTGPDSTNIIKETNVSKYKVTNNNTISVSNTNTQTATSGNASVYDNTTGGDATSGNATNTNSTTVDLKLTN